MAGTGLGNRGQADVTSVNSGVSCHLGLGLSREVAGINVFFTINEEHSYAVHLLGAADGPGPGN